MKFSVEFKKTFITCSIILFTGFILLSNKNTNIIGGVVLSIPTIIFLYVLIEGYFSDEED